MIEIKSVSKTYHQKNVEVKALKDFSLELPSKGLIFIIGKSGSGKSTLLNILGGLDSFDEGDIIIENRSMKEFKEQDANDYRNSYVGFVFQDFNLIEDHSVEKNISLGTNEKEEIIAPKITEILNKVELTGLEKRKPNTLSGGQKQRVAIARALIKNPKLLLCDEPTGQLDYETGEAIFSLLKEISQEDLVVVVSHDLEAANKYGDRVIRLRDGIIESDNKKEQITEEKESILELKQYKLSNSNAMSLAGGFLKTRPIRLIIALFISIIVFMFFCISDTIGSYNRNKVILEHLYENGNDYISYYKSYRGITDDGDKMGLFAKMNDEDIEFLKSKTSFSEYDIVYDYLNDGRYNLGDTTNLNSDYYTTTVSGSCAIDEEFLKRYDYEIYGKMPTTDEEVVITKYVYEMYQKFGYREEDWTITPIETMDDLIGRFLRIGGMSAGGNSNKTFKIVGIIDTKFNYERYEVILTSDDEEFCRQLSAEMYSMMEYGLHNIVFFRQSVFDSIKEEKKYNYKDSDFILVSTSTNPDYIEDKEYMGCIETHKNIADLKIYWKKDALTALSKNQILLPLSCKTNNKNYYVNKKIEEYASDHYKSVSEYFVSMYQYADYIKNNVENEFDPQCNYEYFELLACREFLSPYFQYYTSSEISTQPLTSVYSKKVEIVGFYDDYEMSRNISTVFVSEDFFKEFKTYLGPQDNDYNFLVIPLQDTFKKDIKLIEFSKEKFKYEMNFPIVKLTSEFYSYDMENEIVWVIENEVEGSLEIVNSIFKYGSIGLILLVIIFVSFYFSGVIVDKEKEVGILRALGASKKDVTKIFLIECLIISIVSIIISISISVILINVLNNYLIGEFHLIQSVYMFGIRQIVLIIILEIIIFMVGIILPLLKLMKKKPVDIIAKRN